MRFCFVLTFLFVHLSSFSQIADTLNLREVEIKATPNLVSKAFKNQKIDSVLLSQNPSASLDELLEKSGLQTRTEGRGNLSTLMIRGTASQHTRLFWNGIDISSSTLGLTDYSVVPTAFVNKTEIHYGASGLIDGSGTLGGSIQLFQEADFTNKLKLAVSQQFESFNTNNVNSQISFGNNKWQSQSAYISKKSNNNYPYIDVSEINKPIVNLENASYNQQGYMQNIFYRNNRHSLSAKFNYFESERNLPPAIGVKNANEFRSDNNLRSLVDWGYLRDKSKSLVKLSYIKDNQYYENELMSIESRIITEKFTILYNEYNQLSSYLDLKSGILSELNYANSDGFDSKKEQQKFALFSSLEFHKNKLFLNLLARQELLDNTLQPFTPSFGGNYGLYKELFFIKGNVSRTFRNPTLNDLYWVKLVNPKLLPENGVSYEFGLEKKGEIISFEITYYNNHISNWIQWQPDANGQSKPKNLKEVLSQGIEITSKIEKKISVFSNRFALNYTYADSKNIDSKTPNDATVGKQLMYIPEHKFSYQYAISYKHTCLTYDQIYTSSMFTQSDNSNSLPAYRPANISISYYFRILKENKLSFQFTVKNLLDEEYQVVENRPIPGRNYSVTIQYQFNK